MEETPIRRNPKTPRFIGKEPSDIVLHLRRSNVGEVSEVHSIEAEETVQRSYPQKSIGRLRKRGYEVLRQALVCGPCGKDIAFQRRNRGRPDGALAKATAYKAEQQNAYPNLSHKLSPLLNFGSTACETRSAILVNNAGLSHYGEFYARPSRRHLSNACGRSGREGSSISLSRTSSTCAAKVQRNRERITLHGLNDNTRSYCSVPGLDCYTFVGNSSVGSSTKNDAQETAL